ncbi:uncharacterized protein LOC114480058 [Gouania willdenowi]|uniref:uncharacterized protein LOC114480058 n=1 Tax=Gouania willdenowi TaxID=441366 RepID=UPI00105621FF|nr:uncharacterized protein LOC114480058 [Gouania willdenowi]
MVHPPQVLTLMLKRFKFVNRYKVVINNQRVKFPSRLTVEEKHDYELYAFVEHGFGHYTVKIKSQDDEKWYHFNDDHVRLMDFQPFQLNNSERSYDVYLLFYRKIHTENTEPYPSSAFNEETETIENAVKTKKDKEEKLVKDKVSCVNEQKDESANKRDHKSDLALDEGRRFPLCSLCVLSVLAAACFVLCCHFFPKNKIMELIIWFLNTIDQIFLTKRTSRGEPISPGGTFAAGCTMNSWGFASILSIQNVDEFYLIGIMIVGILLIGAGSFMTYRNVWITSLAGLVRLPVISDFNAQTHAINKLKSKQEAILERQSRLESDMEKLIARLPR